MCVHVPFLYSVFLLCVFIQFKPIDDKSKIKDTLALGTPTQTSTKLHNTFLNQIIGANQVVTANANEDAANGRVRIPLSFSLFARVNLFFFLAPHRQALEQGWY